MEKAVAPPLSLTDRIRNMEVRDYILFKTTEFPPHSVRAIISRLKMKPRRRYVTKLHRYGVEVWRLE